MTDDVAVLFGPVTAVYKALARDDCSRQPPFLSRTLSDRPRPAKRAPRTRRQRFAWDALSKHARTPRRGPRWQVHVKWDRCYEVGVQPGAQPSASQVSRVLVSIGDAGVSVPACAGLQRDRTWHVLVMTGGTNEREERVHVDSACGRTRWGLHVQTVEGNTYEHSGELCPPHRGGTRVEQLHVTMGQCVAFLEITWQLAPVADAGGGDPVRYQFENDDSTVLACDTQAGYRCPWCGVHGRDLHSLLAHLNRSHTYMRFKCTPPLAPGDTPGIRVQLRRGVRFSEQRQFLFAQRARSWWPHGYWCAPTDASPPESPAVAPDLVPALASKVFFHTCTRLPMHTALLADDSEDEPDSEWLFETQDKLLDELTDVNEGENALMKLWNRFVVKNKFKLLAQKQMSTACWRFVDEYGVDIKRLGVRNNFFLHLVNLRDFRLLEPDTIALIMRHYDTKFNGKSTTYLRGREA